MIGRIAHRQHSVRQESEFIRKEEVFEEVALDKRLPGQAPLRPRREVAVAQPAGTFSRRAVHIDVNGILPERFDRGVKDLPQLGREFAGQFLRYFAVGVFYDPEPAQLNVCPENDYFSVAERIRLEREQAVFSGAERPFDHVRIAQTVKIHSVRPVLSKDLRFENVHRCLRLRFDVDANHTCKFRTHIYDRKTACVDLGGAERQLSGLGQRRAYPLCLPQSIDLEFIRAVALEIVPRAVNDAVMYPFVFRYRAYVRGASARDPFRHHFREIRVPYPALEERPRFGLRQNQLLIRTRARVVVRFRKSALERIALNFLYFFVINACGKHAVSVVFRRIARRGASGNLSVFGQFRAQERWHIYVLERVNVVSGDNNFYLSRHRLSASVRVRLRAERIEFQPVNAVESVSRSCRSCCDHFISAKRHISGRCGYCKLVFFSSAKFCPERKNKAQVHFLRSSFCPYRHCLVKFNMFTKHISTILPVFFWLNFTIKRGVLQGK